MSQPPERTGLVLSGGGAHGAFGVGVLKVLLAGRSPGTGYRPLEAGIFTGTSVGCFNAALLVASRRSQLEAAECLESVWVERVASGGGRCGNGVFRIRGDLTELADPSCTRFPDDLWSRFAGDGLSIGKYFLNRSANFLASSQPLDSRTVELFNAQDFVDMSPLHGLLRDVIDPADIFNSPKRLKIVATNWVTGTAYDFNNSDFVGDRGFRAVMASTAIPGVFQPVQIGSDFCVDGGVVQNTPLKPAIELGATELHVVYLNPSPRVVPLLGQPNTIDTLLRVYFMMLAFKVDIDIESARRMNNALRAIEGYRGDRGTASLSDRKQSARLADEVSTAYRRQYKKLVIHRYFPQKALGGSLSILNFDRSHVLKMLREGEYSALNHNCDLSECVLQ